MSYEALQLALFTNDIERVGPIEKIISPLGWRLVAAVMQKQPIQWILEQEVELMLLDLDMPNSIHLLSSLNRCRPTVPILAITSEQSIDKVHDALEMGAKDFITYPIKPKRLMAALHSAIGERSTTVSNIIPIFDDEPTTSKPQNGQVKSVKAAAITPTHRQAVETIDDFAVPFISEEADINKPELESTIVEMANVEGAGVQAHRQTAETIDDLAAPFTSEDADIDKSELKSAIVEAVEVESTEVQELGETISNKIDGADDAFQDENPIVDQVHPTVAAPIAPSPAQPAPVQSMPAPAQPVPVQSMPAPVQPAPVQSMPAPAQPMPVQSMPAPAQPMPVQSIPAPAQPVPAPPMPLRSRVAQMLQETVAPKANAADLEASGVEQVEMHHRMPPTESQRIDTPASIEEHNTKQDTTLKTKPATTKAQNPPPVQFQHSAELTMSLPSVPGKTTAVVSLRGGIGRSTIATNLAVAIAQKGYGNVTLVEAHHGLSNLSLMLHLHPKRTLSTLETEHTIDRDIVRGYLQQHTSGVNILSAPTEIEDMVELSSETWGHLLEIIAGLANHTIIDTSSSADSALTEVLLHADDILVVTDPDIVSLRSATALYKNIKSEPSIGGQLHVVINRSGINGGLDEKTIQKQMGQETIASLPFDPALATYAMNRGIPFVQSHPRALLTKRIQELAEKVFEPAMAVGQQNAVKKPATKSFMSFLGR